MSDNPLIPPSEKIYSRLRYFFTEGRPDECWPWKGGLSGEYGRFYWPTEAGSSRRIKAHRAHYMLKNNILLPSEVFVCHSCDNPICVNPGHLFECDHVSNMVDKHNKNRQVQGIAHPNFKLSDKSILEIYESKDTTRALSEKYGVSRSRIRDIRNGTSKRSPAHL